MSKMFHDMEEDVIRRRIQKARDERSNPKTRLENAMPLVELVARILDAGKELDENEYIEPAAGPEKLNESPQGEAEPTTKEELESITDAPEVVGEDGGYED